MGWFAKPSAVLYTVRFEYECFRHAELVYKQYNGFVNRMERGSTVIRLQSDCYIAGRCYMEDIPIFSLSMLRKTLTDSFNSINIFAPYPQDLKNELCEIIIKKALCDFSGIEYKQPDTSEIIQQPTDIAVSDNDSED